SRNSAKSRLDERKTKGPAPGPAKSRLIERKRKRPALGPASRKKNDLEKKKNERKNDTSASGSQRATIGGRRLRLIPKGKPVSTENSDKPGHGSDQNVKLTSKGTTRVAAVKARERMAPTKGSRKKIIIGRGRLASKAKVGEEKTTETKTTVEQSMRRTTTKRKLGENAVTDDDDGVDSDVNPVPPKKMKYSENSDHEDKSSRSLPVPKSKAPVKDQGKSKHQTSKMPLKNVQDSDDDIVATVSPPMSQSKAPVQNSMSTTQKSRTPPNNKAKSQQSAMKGESGDLKIIQSRKFKSRSSKSLEKTTVTQVRTTRSKTRLSECRNGMGNKKRLVIEIKKLTTDDLALWTHSKRETLQLHDSMDMETTELTTPQRSNSPVAPENGAEDGISPSFHNSSLDVSENDLDNANQSVHEPAHDATLDEYSRNVVSAVEDSVNMDDHSGGSEESEADHDNCEGDSVNMGDHNNDGSKVSEADHDNCEDDADFLEFGIEENEEAYNKLQNSDITQNKALIRASFSKNSATSIHPTLGDYKEEFSGVSRNVAEASADTHVGYTIIQPKTVKPLDMLTTPCIYWVLEGAVSVRSGGGTFSAKGNRTCMFSTTLKRRSCLYIPANTAFTIENWGSKKAMLGYSMHRH
ncbi:hypothetical protein Ocin01_07640, partial [Orchesella cincta]